MYLRLPFVIQAKAFDESFKGAKCVSIIITSRNINEVIRIILKILQLQKNTQCLKAGKNKNAYKKHLSSNIIEVIKTIVV